MHKVLNAHHKILVLNKVVQIWSHSCTEITCIWCWIKYMKCNLELIYTAFSSLACCVCNAQSDLQKQLLTSAHRLKPLNARKLWTCAMGLKVKLFKKNIIMNIISLSYSMWHFVSPGQSTLYFFLHYTNVTAVRPTPPKELQQKNFGCVKIQL